MKRYVTVILKTQSYLEQCNFIHDQQSSIKITLCIDIHAALLDTLHHLSIVANSYFTDAHADSNSYHKTQRTETDMPGKSMWTPI